MEFFVQMSAETSLLDLCRVQPKNCEAKFMENFIQKKIKKERAVVALPNTCALYMPLLFISSC